MLESSSIRLHVAWSISLSTGTRSEPPLSQNRGHSPRAVLKGAWAASPGCVRWSSCVYIPSSGKRQKELGWGLRVWQLLLKTTTREWCLSLLLMGSCKEGWEAWPLSGWPGAPP